MLNNKSGVSSKMMYLRDFHTLISREKSQDQHLLQEVQKSCASLLYRLLKQPWNSIKKKFDHQCGIDKYKHVNCLGTKLNINWPIANIANGIRFPQLSTNN